MRKGAPVTSVEEYLAKVPEPARKALSRLRATIKAAAPRATEGMSYGVPAFKHDGMLVSFGAAARHCAFYVMSPAVMESHASELEGYAVGKGSIRFSAEEPLPVALVKKLVKARIAENRARRK